MRAPRIEVYRGGPTACGFNRWQVGPTGRGGWDECDREARFVVVRSGIHGERRQAACPVCAGLYSAAAAVPMPGERTLFERGVSP